MKTGIITAITILGLAFSAGAAEDKHGHGLIKLGPTNGKLLTSVKPHVEFLVTTENKIELRFVDEANKVVAPGEQEVTITMGDRAKPTKLTFAKEGDKLVSSGTIPEGNDFPTVVQIRAKAGAKAVNEKFNLDLAKCPTCSNSEYVCKCDHAHEDKPEPKKK